MKALVLKRDKQLEYMNVPRSEPFSADSILVKVVSSGICGSDIPRGFEGGAYHYPLIMGHEFAGIIEESFSGGRFKKGDRVVVFPLLPCRECIPCQTGDFAQCLNYNYFGSRCDGGFAEYVYVPEDNLIPVPDHVDMIHAAMTEPCAVALHGVNKINIKPGDIGAVFGGGTIGNIAAQWLRIRGCAKVILVDIDDHKLKVAADMGFTQVNSREKDPVEFITSETGGKGADYVIEACGLPQTFLQTVQAAGKFGQVVFMGNIKGQFIIGEKDFSSILRKELKIFGTWNSKIVPRGHNEWTTVLMYMDRTLRVEPLISHKTRLEEGPEIFQKIVTKTLESYSKVIFQVSREVS